MKGLELLDKIPAAEVVERKCQEELDRQRGLSTESVEHAAIVKTESDSAIEAAINDRKQIEPTLTGPVLEIYEASQAKHAGSAICYANDEICEGCSGSLVRVHILQVKARAEIVRCPHCYRIQDYRLPNEPENA
jgi:predicted  nucleic acid-binding Zn-ribbon protein